MRPYLEEAFGNPSSGHWASAPAKAAIGEARAQIAALLSCAADEVVFTSGGSEANKTTWRSAFHDLAVCDPALAAMFTDAIARRIRTAGRLGR